MLRFHGSMDDPRSVLQVFDHNQETVVEVRSDGTVQYAEGVNLDRASRQFWMAIGQTVPEISRADHEDQLAELERRHQVERYLSETDAA